LTRGKWQFDSWATFAEKRLIGVWTAPRLSRSLPSSAAVASRVLAAGIRSKAQRAEPQFAGEEAAVSGQRRG
jgi:hypothetical protein